MIHRSCLKSLVTVSLLGLMSASQAEVTASANVSLTSDYRFRGVSQNINSAGVDAEPALQGGFDLEFGNGFYLGNWNSNVSFDGSTLEMDFYGGYAAEVGEFNYDLGVLYYYYPGQNETNDNAAGSDDVDTLELYGFLGYHGFTLGLAYTISDDYFGTDNQDGTTYLTLSYDHSFTDKLSLTARIGQTSYQNEAAFNASTEGDYVDYLVGLNYNFAGFDFGLSYVDTDIETNAALGSTRNNLNDGTVIFSVGKSF